jgi:hypothetical protein
VVGALIRAHGIPSGVPARVFFVRAVARTLRDRFPQRS